MKKDPSNNQSPWERRSVPPAQTYFTDQALPPDGYIETDQALPADGHVEENLDCSYLLRGLWPEAAKEWFIWNEGEKPRAIEVAVNIEKLCGDYDEWWRKKVEEFVEFKAAYDEKKVAGKYVDPHEDWPFDPCHPRKISLPGDLPALYALLCRFHDWLPGFDQLFSEGEPAVEEFSSQFSSPGFERQFEQRSVRVEELEEFFEYVKKDIEENCVCRQAENIIEDEKRKTPDEAKAGLHKHEEQESDSLQGRKWEELDKLDRYLVGLYQRWQQKLENDKKAKFPSLRNIEETLKKHPEIEDELKLTQEGIRIRLKKLTGVWFAEYPYDRHAKRKTKETSYDPDHIEDMVDKGEAHPLR